MFSKDEYLDYIDFNGNSYQICESGNLYGHVKKFTKLSKKN